MEPKNKGFSLRRLFLRDDPADTRALAAPKSVNEAQHLAGPKALSIERITLLRIAPDIGQWRAALAIAESKTNPDRRLLYQVYNEVTLDAHVISVTQRLKLRCTNNPIVWRPATKTQTTPPAIQAIISAPWFTDLIEYIIESKWYGHSLIQLNFLEKNYVPDARPGVELIARPNVRPEFGDVLPAPGATSNAIPFRTPPYTNFLLECGRPNDLGLFNGIAPNVLFKRYGVKDWAEFLEVYGMPLRKAEYDPNQPGQRTELESIMRDMGSNAGIIIPRGSTMELIDSAKAGNSQAFDLYAAFHNAEISKAMLLQTMTTSDGSSLSQAEVHQRAEDEAVMGYRLYVLRYLNSTFKAILQRHGLPVTDGQFEYDNRERLSMSQMADVVIKLQNVADIPMSWIYDTFGIPAPGPGDVIKSNQAVSSQQPDLATTEEKKKLTLPDYPAPHGHLQLSLSEGALTGIEEELLRRIYTDQVATGRIDRTYFFALSRQLTDAVAEGLLAAEWSSAQPSDYRTLLEANVQRFSAAKTLALVQQLNQAKNAAATFAEFRQAVAPLLSNYNANWLRTEYNHAVAAAQMGAAWRQAYAQREQRGFWQYVTAGDDRVRPAHAALDGMIFRLDDPEAARLWPPNDFGCRCDGVTLAASPRRTPNTLTDAVAAMGGDAWARATAKGWDTNWGQQAIIFRRSMEYIASFAPNSLTPASWGLSSAAQASRPALPKGGQLPTGGLQDYRSVAVPLAPGVSLPAGVSPRAATDTFSAPAEVWLQEAAGRILRIYLRYYQGGAVVITTAVSPTEPEQIVSITFTTAPEGLRAGILSYK